MAAAVFGGEIEQRLGHTAGHIGEDQVADDLVGAAQAAGQLVAVEETNSILFYGQEEEFRSVREALRIIKAATDLTGDLNRALFWYRTEPLAVFGYKTAERLASEGRTDDVLRYVSSLEAGAAG